MGQDRVSGKVNMTNISGGQPELCHTQRIQCLRTDRLRPQHAVPHVTHLSVTAGNMKNIQRWIATTKTT